MSNSTLNMAVKKAVATIRFKAIGPSQKSDKMSKQPLEQVPQSTDFVPENV